MKVREFGLLTVPHVCVLSISLPNRTTYQVEKESARPRGQIILKSNVMPGPRVFNCFPQQLQTTSSKWKALANAPDGNLWKDVWRSLAVGCTAGNMQHSDVAYLQSVEKCIEYVCTVWRISFHRGKDKIRRNDHL